MLFRSLNISRDGVSRMEEPGDFLLSALGSRLEAMGGQPRLIAEFPQRRSVTISGLDSLATGTRAPRHGHGKTGASVFV